MPRDTPVMRYELIFASEIAETGRKCMGEERKYEPLIYPIQTGVRWLYLYLLKSWQPQFLRLYQNPSIPALQTSVSKKYRSS